MPPRNLTHLPAGLGWGAEPAQVTARHAMPTPAAQRFGDLSDRWMEPFQPPATQAAMLLDPPSVRRPGVSQSGPTPRPITAPGGAEILRDVTPNPNASRGVPAPGCGCGASSSGCPGISNDEMSVSITHGPACGCATVSGEVCGCKGGRNETLQHATIVWEPGLFKGSRIGISGGAFRVRRSGGYT